MTKGKFIALEGLDGSGKSTQAELLAQHLRRLSIPVCVTAEPTERFAGKRIKDLMKQDDAKDGSLADHLEIAALFVADRIRHVLDPTDGMKAQLEAGFSVISSRYYFSSYAYHAAYAGMEWVVAANSLCSRHLKPDLNIFVDVPIDDCVERLVSLGIPLDRYERGEILKTVREKYFEAFHLLRDTERIVCVDGAGSEEDISARIWHAAESLFSESPANQ